MAGFDGMKQQDRSGPGEPPNPQELFEMDVDFIFPDSPTSRLARACGGVTQRTAQKWISHAITPPADVDQYVRIQKAELKRTKFDVELEAVIHNHSGNLDVEVVASQIVRAYEKLTGYKIK